MNKYFTLHNENDYRHMHLFINIKRRIYTKVKILINSYVNIENKDIHTSCTYEPGD